MTKLLTIIFFLSSALSCTHKKNAKISHSETKPKVLTIGIQPYTVVSLNSKEWKILHEFSNSAWETESVSFRNKIDTGMLATISSINELFGKSRTEVAQLIKMTLSEQNTDKSTVQPIKMDSFIQDSFMGFYFLLKDTSNEKPSYQLTLSGYCFNGLGLTNVFITNGIADYSILSIAKQLDVFVQFLDSIKTYSISNVHIENERIKAKYKIVVEELPLDSIYYSWTSYSENGDTIEHYTNDRTQIPKSLIHHPIIGKKTYCGRINVSPNLTLTPIRIEVINSGNSGKEDFTIRDGRMIITSTEMRRTAVLKTGYLIVQNSLGLESQIPFSFSFNPSIQKK